MNEHYVYMYLREDGTPYYVGKGKGHRAYNKRHTVKVPDNLTRIVFVATSLTDNESRELEKRLILQYGRKDIGTGILRNLTDGGDGPSGVVRTEEHKRKISQAMKGRVISEEHRQKLKGRVISEEHRQKLKGRVISEEHRQKLKGRVISEEHRQKISAANKGRQPSIANKLARAKHYMVTSPEKDIYYTSNLHQFCIDNGLNSSCMNRVAKGTAKQHKGWLCSYAPCVVI